MEQIEVASEKFNLVTTEAEFTRVESELSFLQVRATMKLLETSRQVTAEICEDRKQISGKHCGCGKSGKCGLCHQVPTSGGHPEELHQLHQ